MLQFQASVSWFIILLTAASILTARGTWVSQPTFPTVALPRVREEPLADGDWITINPRDSQEVTLTGARPAEEPDMFVSVRAAPFHAGGSVRRDAVRKSIALHMKRTGVAALRIAVDFQACRGRGENEELKQEVHKYQDLSRCDCEEGQHHLLKLALTEYQRQCPSLTCLFVRVEDSVFVAWNRLFKLVALRPNATNAHMFYAGRIFAEDTSSKTAADAQHRFTHMQAPGYVLGGSVVREFIAEEFPSHSVSEDRLAFELIQRLRVQRNLAIDQVDLGHVLMNAPKNSTWRTWKSYPFVMQSALQPETVHCLLARELQDPGGLPEAPFSPTPVGDCFVESIFVAIFSAHDYASRRHHVRHMVSSAHEEGIGKFQVLAKFILCKQREDTASGASATDALLPAELADEAATNGDMVFVDCVEGYGQGLLTRKLAATLDFVVNNPALERKLFMKVDDDTFVSWGRLRSFMAGMDDGLEHVYMGQPLYGVKVNRNVSSSWYQPEANYSQSRYPPYMEGGAGYILGNALVANIVSQGLHKRMVLSNEDQAMGVWVHSLQKRGVPVRFIGMNSVNGDFNGFDVCSGHWQDYNKVLMFHKLKGDVISCLSRLSFEEASGIITPTASVERCFPVCFKARQARAKREIRELEKHLKEMHAVNESQVPPEQEKRDMRLMVDSVEGSLTWLKNNSYPDEAGDDSSRFTLNRFPRAALQGTHKLVRLTSGAKAVTLKDLTSLGTLDSRLSESASATWDYKKGYACVDRAWLASRLNLTQCKTKALLQEACHHPTTVLYQRSWPNNCYCSRSSCVRPDERTKTYWLDLHSQPTKSPDV